MQTTVKRARPDKRQVLKAVRFSGTLATAVKRACDDEMIPFAVFVRTACLQELRRRGLQKYLTTAS